jgi:hypothetical protein
VGTWVLINEMWYYRTEGMLHGLDPKPTFRAEGDHSRDIRRRRERGSRFSPGPAASYRRHWAGVLGGRELASL